MEEQQREVIDLQSTIEAMHEISEGEREGGRELEEQQRWVIDLQSKIGTINYEREVEIQSKKCIYRVPRILRDLNEDAYTPQLISFGPYHHGKAHLKLMESYNLAQYLERANRSLAQVAEAFRPVVQDLMDAYDDLEEPWSTDNERFLELMILDGCCLLKLIIHDFGIPEVERSYMLTATWMDPRRLENQLPLLVLAILIEMGGHEVEYSEKIFDDLGYVPGEQRTIRGMGHHWLDMERRANTNSGDYFYDPKWTVRSAVELFQAGVSFKPSQTRCYSDISFKNGVLYLPIQTWYTNAESHLLNSIAFENIHNGTSEATTHHVFLMDNIIDTDKDVALLKEKGIISCTTGSNSEIASLFNRLTKELPVPSEPAGTIHITNVNKNLENYCNKRWNKWRASFMQTYLANPWVFSPLVAAFVLLVLTILQTTYTILPYYHHVLTPNGFDQVSYARE
ncbi:uncharacterized protein A4U43_C01F34970 [Asparagus officinalis]|uniref:Uncharacterized protein n=1 Tax=Asparagus officinalis TaxID=4686 RepID=A0A5P1FX22_ASPOF|nr:UPF0481 protein At3g47200-like [Asparagus officinalis]ONK81989.1 uncharacterized protein A4U43_C01F34970 [Asparagus officinalis]